jgi:hypothetical protein
MQVHAGTQVLLLLLPVLLLLLMMRGLNSLWAASDEPVVTPGLCYLGCCKQCSTVE